MNHLNFLLFALCLTLITTATFLLISIRKNFIHGQSFRSEFRDRIEATRLGKMLRKHNVDPHELVHSQPISGIVKQIRTCRDCVKTTECSRILAKAYVSENELALCPNHLSILSHN